MKNQALTAKQIQYMKPDPQQRREVPAGPPLGLYCILQPSGKKSFALRYRWHGLPRKLTFAKAYPDLSLAGARAEAEAALDTLARGVDPAVAKAEEEARIPDSVQAVAGEWIKKKVEGTRTCDEVSRIVNKEIVPAWKHRLIDEVGRADVLRLLDGIVERGAPVLANRTRSILLRFFGWGLERGYLEVSPVAGIRPLAREESRDRVLSDDELLEAWNAADTLGYPFGPFLRLLILTAQRRGEVAGMRWQDVDLESGLWTLPAEQVKSNRVHDVPLSEPALDVLRSLPRFEGPFIFTTTSGEKPINGFSKSKAALDAAILEAGKDEIRKTIGWTVHDLRRTAATWMAGAGVPPHVLSALLNHSPSKVLGITAIYNRFRYLEERRAALSRWADHVLELAKQPKRRVLSA